MKIEYILTAMATIWLAAHLYADWGSIGHSEIRWAAWGGLVGITIAIFALRNRSRKQ